MGQYALPLHAAQPLLLYSRSIGVIASLLLLLGDSRRETHPDSASSSQGFRFLLSPTT